MCSLLSWRPRLLESYFLSLTCFLVVYAFLPDVSLFGIPNISFELWFKLIRLGGPLFFLNAQESYASLN
jgi:hypothetical protein